MTERLMDPGSAVRACTGEYIHYTMQSDIWRVACKQQGRMNVQTRTHGLTHTHSHPHLIVSIMSPTDGRITKALVVKGQILPEDVSSANVKQN